MTPLNELADLVSAKLTALGLKAERVYLPRFDMADFESLQARVVAVSDEGEIVARAAAHAEFKIQVGIAKAADPGATETLDKRQLDALMDRVQAIKAGLYADKRLGNYVLTKIVNDPAYHADSLEQERLFLSLLLLTFKGQAC